MNLTQGIYDKLRGDATLTSLLASYPEGSPDGPAIFTGWPIPPDATRPYLWTRGEVSATHWDEINTVLGVDVLRDVYAFADNDGSEAAVETIARRVKTLLHRQSLTIPGGKHLMTICVSGPVVADTDDTLTGRIVTFRIVAIEE